MNSFTAIVDRLSIEPSESSMPSLIDWIQNDKPVTDDDIAHLARRLSESGETLSLGQPPNTTDIASTGGPTSLATLVCPLQLRSPGWRVPKLACAGQARRRN